MKNLDTPLRRRALDDTHFLWRSWDSDVTEHDSDPLTVLFFKDSDDTLLLNSFCVRIIRILQEKPYTLRELESALSREFFGDETTPLPVGISEIETFLKRMTLAGILEVTE